MTESKPCQGVYDEILSGNPLSPELASHIEKCEACRNLLQTLEKVRAAKTVLPDDTFQRLRSRVMKGLVFPFAAHGILSKLLGKALITGLVIGGGLLAGAFFSRLVSPPLETRPVMETPVPAPPVPAATPAPIASGTGVAVPASDAHSIFTGADPVPPADQER